jgi:phosphatidylglycerophosphate synthase
MAELGVPARAANPATAQATAAVALAVALAAGLAAMLAPGARPEAALLGAGLMAAGGVAALAGLARSYPHDRFGLCNLITLLRAAMVAGLAALLASPAGAAADDRTAWAALGVAVAALALDGVDGWAARRSGLSSRFGARFDMEVDVALALTLALLIWHSDKLGAWVILLGAPRHLFLAAALFAPALRAPLPPALWRKAGCVAQIGALIVVLAPPVGPAAAAAAALTGLALVGAAFGRDVAWLLREARRREG